MRWKALALLGAYVGTIVAANWAIARFGMVPVWPGLAAPAGVYFAGFAFTLRDLLDDAAGRAFVVVAIAVGALLSLAVSPPALAVASAVAFAVSELADLAVYRPLRRRWVVAALASNVVGLVVDSALFLWLAFGSLAFVGGQVVGKLWVTAVSVLAVWGARRALRTGRR